jgi:hypothetical protein
LPIERWPWVAMGGPVASHLMGWTALPPALQIESLHQEGEPV